LSQFTLFFVVYVFLLNISNFAKFEFVALDITRKNYLYWILNVEMHLDAMGLRDIIKKEINDLSN